MALGESHIKCLVKPSLTIRSYRSDNIYLSKNGLSNRQYISNLPWGLLALTSRGFFRKVFAACVVTLAASVCLKATFTEISRETTPSKAFGTVALAFAKAYHLKRPSFYDFAGLGDSKIPIIHRVSI